MKNLYRVLALTLSVLMLLSFAACGGSKNESSKPNDSSSQTSEPASQPESTPESEPADNGDGNDSSFKFASIQEFIDSDMFQNQWGSMTQELDGSGMSIELKGEGDTLVYLFTYDDFSSDDFDEDTLTLMADTLKEALEDDSTGSTFVSIAKSLKAAVNVDKPAVRVSYQTSDGVEIASHEYSAD